MQGMPRKDQVEMNGIDAEYMRRGGELMEAVDFEDEELSQAITAVSLALAYCRGRGEQFHLATRVLREDQDRLVGSEGNDQKAYCLLISRRKEMKLIRFGKIVINMDQVTNIDLSIEKLSPESQAPELEGIPEARIEFHDGEIRLTNEDAKAFFMWLDCNSENGYEPGEDSSISDPSPLLRDHSTYPSASDQA